MRDFLRHPPIRPVNNQLFHVQTPNGKNGIKIKQLDNVPVYNDQIIERWKEEKAPSVTHNTLHGVERGKMSFEVDVPDIKQEYIDIIEKEVNDAASFYNYEGKKATLYARQMLLYEPGFGCVVHCDDQDTADREYGLGTVVFNWANQLIALMFVSTEGEHYTGGALHFPNANFDVHGQHGKLVLCPGHYKYRHGVAPILSGYRLAMQTTWRFDE